MKKKINLGKKLQLSKEKLSKLNDEQLHHLMGGRMAAATAYTSGSGNCSYDASSCCSTTQSACCG